MWKNVVFPQWCTYASSFSTITSIYRRGRTEYVLIKISTLIVRALLRGPKEPEWDYCSKTPDKSRYCHDEPCLVHIYSMFNLHLQIYLSVPGSPLIIWNPSSPSTGRIFNKCMLVKPCKIIDRTGVLDTFFVKIMIDSLHDSDVHTRYHQLTY
jgi:hypothetical protein